MKTNKILDKDIDSTNYAGFKKCSVLNNGNRIKFVFVGGASYDVPLDYVLLWFSKPHYMVKNGKAIEWDETKNTFDRKNVKALRCRRIIDNFSVRLYLSNDTAFDVAWDTVLMACERNYEYFGGLTDEARNTVSNWHEDRGGEIKIKHGGIAY